MTISAQDSLFDLKPAATALLVNVPHAGTMLPGDLEKRLRPEARVLSDTDWHMDRIARAALPEGAGLMVAKASRYAVDLNRPSDDRPLYAGATTGLISTIDFDGNPLYAEGSEPDEAERARRVEAYWMPYHHALASEIARIRDTHGYCVMLDVHSIRSRVPRLFEGTLPDLNLGTNKGESADPSLCSAVADVLAASDMTSVRDGRFTGGYITRHYGRPGEGVHVLQIETAQSIYMQESPPWTLDPGGAERLQAVLARMLAVMAAFSPSGETE